MTIRFWYCEGCDLRKYPEIWDISIRKCRHCGGQVHYCKVEFRPVLA